jgi:hypothetical protein
MISHAKPNGAADKDTAARESAQGGHRSAGSGPRGPHPLEPLLADLASLRSYLAHYVAARKDALTAAARRAVLWAVIGIAAALVGMTILVTAVVLLVMGIMDGLTVVFGGRLWAGELVTAVGLLTLVGLGGWIGISKWITNSRRRTMEHYERRRSQERAVHGLDVRQRAEQRPLRG